jgi:hypothetical protein
MTEHRPVRSPDRDPILPGVDLSLWTRVAGVLVLLGAALLVLLAL